MLKRICAPLAVAAIALSAVLAPATVLSAGAAPGNPGVPSDPVVLYQETFENGLAAVQNTLLTDYVGADGTTYGGSPYWTAPSMCNGIIIRNNSVAPAGCDPSGATHIRQMANALGQLNGTADPTLNHAVSAYTNGATAEFPLGVNDVEFQTETPIAVPSGSRFITFSVNSTVINCFAEDPLLSFSLVDGGTEYSATETPINVCTDPAGANIVVNGSAYLTGTFYSDGSVLFSGTELGIIMRNGTASATGNDHAYDDITVLDATPQLDKTFGTAPAEIPNWIVGDEIPLTFTVTNTSELAQKDGWGFVDSLPEGMLAATTAPTTTCDAASITATPGSDTLTIADGLLGTGDVSCEIVVYVVASQAGEFANGPDDVATTGLNPPAETMTIVEAPDPELTITKTGELVDTNGNGVADVGETVDYEFLVENTGNLPITGVTVVDPKVTGVLPASADIAVDGSQVFTASYVVVQEDVDSGELANTAFATGIDRDGGEVESNEDEEILPTPERAPALDLHKEAVLNDTNGNGLADRGETIVYSFEVTNVGNVTVTDIVIDDPRVTGILPASADLAPLESVWFESDPYVVTSADESVGKVQNTAVATGISPLGPLTSNQASVVTPATLAVLALTGLANVAPYALVGSLLAALGVLLWVSRRRVAGA